MKPMIFEKATPESQGIDSELLLKALEAAENGAPRGGNRRRNPDRKPRHKGTGEPKAE